MGLGSIFLILALLILVALFVARPLVEDEDMDWRGDPERSTWLAERERVLDALLELDFDHELEKVPDSVYAEQRQRLLAQGAEALKHLDALKTGQSGKKGVEKALAGRKKSGKGKRDDLEALIAAHKKGKRR